MYHSFENLVDRTEKSCHRYSTISGILDINFVMGYVVSVTLHVVLTVFLRKKACIHGPCFIYHII